MGLGSLRDVSLAEAREKAVDLRRQLAEGLDPIETRRADKDRLRQQREGLKTFGAFADDYVDAIAGGFSNDKHLAQWRMTLGPAYCGLIRDVPVAELSTDHVLAVLEPVWLEKCETASRLRGRIERVLDAAKVKGLRNGENPARWRGHLDALLPKQPPGGRSHHKAMAYADVPEFVARLRSLQSVSARALEFAILTASRTSEVLEAVWDEIDLANRLWTIPARRMKARRPHIVPLTDRSVAILEEVRQLSRGDHVFPGARAGKPLSNMALTMVLRGLVGDAATVHGFRSSFRDWAGDETGFDRDIAELALAHAVGSKTEQAYRRKSALQKRRDLMVAWDAYCG